MLKTFTKGQWRLVLDAYGIAGQVLNNKTARQAITDGTVNKPAGLSGNGDPRDVLKDIFDRGKNMHSILGYGVAVIAPASSPSNVENFTANRGLEHDDAMHAFAAAGTAEHPRGYIRISKGFFNSGIVNNLLWGAAGPPKLDDPRTRALILLHEIKHIITGDYSNTHDVPFNNKIYNDGFKNLILK